MQYKEEVWTYLEREIRKVVHKDSDLLQKVQTKTRILTNCLAQNKVSTVVKQNAALVDDHDRATKAIGSLVDSLRQEIQLETNMRRVGRKVEHVPTAELRLNDMVCELTQLVDVMKTKTSLVEEENLYLRQENRKLRGMLE